MRDLVHLDPASVLELVAASTAGSLADALLEKAARLGGVEEIFAYARHGTERPRLVASASRILGAADRARSYVARHYRNDPLLFRHRTIADQTGFVEHVRAQEIMTGDYRRTCFSEPGFNEKLSFGFKWPETIYVLSFYSRAELELPQALLEPLACLALGLIRSNDCQDSLDTIHNWLHRTYPELPRREREICSRTMLGATSASIGMELGIAVPTVLTYRRRAYQRLGISSASQLLTRIRGII
jgi:DNA-binding CsgD family transcriptional regulator